MCRSSDLTVRVRPSALLAPALFLLLTDTPALLAALLLAAFLHELAHYAVLRLCGVRTACFTLTGLGASLYAPELHRLSYGAELLSAAAGPLMNLLLWVVLSLTGRDELTLFAGAQMVLGILNLLPVILLFVNLSFFLQSSIFWLLIGGALVAFANSWLLRKVFKKNFGLD